MKKKILWVGDAVVQTGFGRVTSSILKYFNSEKFDVEVAGVGYSGEHHEYPYPIWSLNHLSKNDPMGYKTLPIIIKNVKPDIVVLFNDPWVVNEWLKSFLVRKNNEILKKFPEIKLVAYLAIDSRFIPEKWISRFNHLDLICTYTEFGKSSLLRSFPKAKIKIVPHGIDPEVFFPVPRHIARKKLKIFSQKDFVVFNGNRNQIRKRIDLTVEGFCLFAKGKSNVKLCLNMKEETNGWNIKKIMEENCIRNQLDINKVFYMSNKNEFPLPIETLNLLYNCCDVGINTSVGEGWGLVSFEQAACGIPQVVPEHSACFEIFKEKAFLLPIREWIYERGLSTEGGLTSPQDIKNKLEEAYKKPGLRAYYASEMKKYLLKSKFIWENISKKFQEILLKLYH